MNNKYNVGDVVKMAGRTEPKVIAVWETRLGRIKLALEFQDGSCGTYDENDITKLIKAAPPSFELGEEVEVRERNELDWTKRLYLFSENGQHFCQIVRHEFGLGSRNIGIWGWEQIRKIPTEPTIELTCIVNGKKVPLKTLSMDTIQNIRDNE